MASSIRPISPRITAQLAGARVSRDRVGHVLSCQHFLSKFPVITPAAMQILNKHAPWLTRVNEHLATHPLMDHGTLQIMRTLVRVVEFGGGGKTFYYGAFAYCEADRAVFERMKDDFWGSFEATVLETRGHYGIELAADHPVTQLSEEIWISLLLKPNIQWGAVLKKAGFKRILLCRLGNLPAIDNGDERKTLNLPVAFLAGEYSKIDATLTRLLATQPN